MTISLPLPTVGRAAIGTPTQVRPGHGCNCTNCSFYAGDDIDPAVIDSGRWDGPLCSGTNPSCSYCGCARADDSMPGGGCANCSVLCSSRSDIHDWMADVGGTLRFDDIVLPRFTPALPPFIPQSDGSNVAHLQATVPARAWAIGLRRVFSERSWKVLPRFANCTNPKTLLGMNPEQLAVLVGYGKDPLVEAFWSRRIRDNLIATIAGQGWDLVLAPNFSMYGNWSRTAQLTSFRRNMLIAAEFADAGVTCAPNIYWYRLEDLRRYRDWALDTNPGLLAVNLQTFQTPSDWNDMALSGLTWLAHNMPDTIHWVFTGGVTARRLKTVHDLFNGRASFISQRPWQSAGHGETITADGATTPVHARPADAFAASYRNVTSWLDGSAPWPTTATVTS